MDGSWRRQANILYFCLLIVGTQISGHDGQICTEKVCKYNFDVRRGQTMTYIDRTASFEDDVMYNTFNVKLNKTRLQIIGNKFRRGGVHNMIGAFAPVSDVITADGYEREIITINDQFPGPNIEVLEGAEVEVKVNNYFWTETLTIHWHGLSQKNNVWMDGVPHLTQCPIQPKQSFTYRFIAEPVGTHWYHSHMANQRLDGLFGMIIVHKKPPKIPNIPVTLMDWYHQPATLMHVLNPYDFYRPGSGDMHRFPVDYRDYSMDNVENSAIGWQSGIINGRGRFGGQDLPLTNFTLEPGIRHRFRLVHTGAEFTMEISIDRHKLEVVASDGHEIHPVKVDFLLMFPGETYDVEVRANQVPGKYWLRAATIREGDGPNPKQDNTRKEILATVTYRGAESDSYPVSKPRTCSKDYNCVVFNCPFKNYGSRFNRSCVSLDEAESRDKSDAYRTEFGLDDEEIHEYFYNMAFSFGSSVNGKKFLGPSEPFYQNKSRGIVPCDHNQCRSGCACTAIHKMPFNKTVQVVFTGIQPDFDFVAHHSIHIHGHNFAVLKVGYPSYNTTSGHWREQNSDIWCESAMCNNPRWMSTPPELNLVDPPVKDTVVLPARGYVVVRFRTDNPGYWRIHCHQELHLMEGMDMILDEGPGHHPPLPPDFPTCLPFDWTDAAFKKYKNEVINNKGLQSNTGVKYVSKQIISIDSSDHTVTVKLSTMSAIVSASLVIISVILCTFVLIYFCARFTRENDNRRYGGYQSIRHYEDDIEDADDIDEWVLTRNGGRNGMLTINNVRKRLTSKERRSRNRTM